MKRNWQISILNNCHIIKKIFDMMDRINKVKK